MKKLMFIAVASMTLTFGSCGADDVTDFACNTVRDALKLEVQAAITAAAAAPTNKDLCESARAAIEGYKSEGCGDNSFDVALANLNCEAL